MTGAILKLYKPPSVEEWQLLFASLLPGAHVAAIASDGCPYHRMTVNLEDAGFEIRDQIVWISETTIPIAPARKPLREPTIASNVLKYGTGAINVGACRIDTVDDLNGGRYSDNKRGDDGNTYGSGLNLRSKADFVQPQGRFPANVILSKAAGFRLDEQSGVSSSPTKVTRGANRNQTFGKIGFCMEKQVDVPFHGDSGGASRFFKCCDTEQELIAYLRLLITPPEVQCLDRN